MCLAIPVRVEVIQSPDMALVDIGGVRKSINIALVPDVVVGDYVILHVGYALNKIDPQEAQRTLQLFAEVDEVSRQQRLENNP
ncbi:HypC/HybG/HupF family hydrogenase formation chaperone [Neptuniibacter halophilus]|uniref:HypC/HybG/HupF family hydrogenase formation chaperone n=1 Tax=Neptuniibacter halophilus TaxID=651666 RepID=UPI0025745BEF|nr:HypC/HybG/HupF family hydrogenase formation chaperone [Neptuniibacter halophilus]